MEKFTGHLQHLFIQQGGHGVRHDVILERARRHHHMTVAQLFGQLSQGATSPMDLNGETTGEGIGQLLTPMRVRVFFHTYLDVFHVLEEVRLGVAVVGELDQVAEVFFGGKGLDQAGQDIGVLVLHTLEVGAGT